MSNCWPGDGKTGAYDQEEMYAPYFDHKAAWEEYPSIDEQLARLKAVERKIELLGERIDSVLVTGAFVEAVISSFSCTTPVGGYSVYSSRAYHVAGVVRWWLKKLDEFLEEVLRQVGTENFHEDCD